MFQLDSEKEEGDREEGKEGGKEGRRHLRPNCKHLLDTGALQKISEVNICFIDHSKAFDYVGHEKLMVVLKDMDVPQH